MPDTANDRQYSLDELCTLVDLPKRTVRYYIQLGLVARPAGAGRGTHYGTHHLEQLLAIRKWQHAGLSLERIAELLTTPDTDSGVVPPRPRGRGTVEVISRLVIDDGLELRIDPARCGLSSEQVRTFFQQITTAYDHLRKENSHD